MDPLKIYVAGPLSARTEAEKEANIGLAVKAGRLIAEMGHYPFVPHLNDLFDDEGDEPLAYDYWLECDIAFLRCCDAMLFLGPSPGSLKELYEAGAVGLRVFWSVDDIPSTK